MKAVKASLQNNTPGCMFFTVKNLWKTAIIKSLKRFWPNENQTNHKSGLNSTQNRIKTGPKQEPVRSKTNPNLSLTLSYISTD